MVKVSVVSCGGSFGFFIICIVFDVDIIFDCLIVVIMGGVSFFVIVFKLRIIIFKFVIMSNCVVYFFVVMFCYIVIVEV